MNTVSKDLENAFYSLVRTQVKKKRPCITCRKMFMSSSAGKRFCDICMRANKTLGVRAESVIC